MHISIVDIGINNSRSIERAFRNQLESIDTLSILEIPNSDFNSSDLIVIPGVGNFGVAMGNLRKVGFHDQIKAAGNAGRKIVGICLGMQLLFESSEESPGVDGLGLIRGSCKKLTSSISPRVPHVGWNGVNPEYPNSHFGALYENKDFYFAHSFHANPIDNSNILSVTNLENANIVSSVLHQNILGFQFHPEKSGNTGKRLLNEVLVWARNEN